MAQVMYTCHTSAVHMSHKCCTHVTRWSIVQSLQNCDSCAVRGVLPCCSFCGTPKPCSSSPHTCCVLHADDAEPCLCLLTLLACVCSRLLAMRAQCSDAATALLLLLLAPAAATHAAQPRAQRFPCTCDTSCHACTCSLLFLTYTWQCHAHCQKHQAS